MHKIPSTVWLCIEQRELFGCLLLFKKGLINSKKEFHILQWMILSGFMTAILFSVITGIRGKMRVNFHFKKVKCRSHLVYKDTNECSDMYGFYPCVTSRLSIAVHVSKLQIKCIKMSNYVHTCTIPIVGLLRHDYFRRYCCLKYTVWVQTCMNERHDALSHL